MAVEMMSEFLDRAKFCLARNGRLNDNDLTQAISEIQRLSPIWSEVNVYMYPPESAAQWMLSAVIGETPEASVKETPFDLSLQGEGGQRVVINTLKRLNANYPDAF